MNGRTATIFGVSAIAVVSALVTFSYNLGYDKGYKSGLRELDKYKVQLAEKETQIRELIAKTSDEVVTKYVDRVKVIKEKEYVYIKRIEDSLPVQYNLSNGWVHSHEQAVQGLDADPARVADASPSTITDAQALITIIGNYGICKQTAEQLTALQDWIRDAQKQTEQEPTNDGRR